MKRLAMAILFFSISFQPVYSELLTDENTYSKDMMEQKTYFAGDSSVETAKQPERKPASVEKKASDQKRQPASMERKTFYQKYINPKAPVDKYGYTFE